MKKCLLCLIITFFLISCVFPLTVAAVSPEEQAAETGADDDPAALAGEEATDYFTYEEAVELALKNSYKLKNARGDVERSKEIRDRLSNLRGFGYTPVGPGYSDADAAERELFLNFVQADVAWQMARKQVEMVEEGIAFQVRSAYDGVLKKINENKVAGLKLENAAAKMRQADIKAQYGMESLFNLQLARDDYNAEKQNKELLEKQLEEAYLEFNALVGLEKEERPMLKGEFCPAWLEDINLERHLSGIFSEDPSLWMQEQKIKMAEYGLDLYTYNVGALPYKAQEIDVTKEKNNLASMKEDLERSIRSLYNQMQQLQDQYALLEVNLAKAGKALEVVNVRYELGMAIPLDLQQAELAVAQIEQQMQNILISYEQLRILFEKPWLRPPSMQAIQ